MTGTATMMVGDPGTGYPGVPGMATSAISATLSTPLEHYVVLGITPNKDTTCVFVLQLKASRTIPPKSQPKQQLKGSMPK
jgi:hypothetical protein